MASRDDYVNNDMFDQDEAIAAAVDKRKFLLKRPLEDQGRFLEQRSEKWVRLWKTSLPKLL